MVAFSEPLQLPKYSNNSQAVERAAKLVSDASHQVSGLENRHELILSKVAARAERPSFKSRKDFAPML